MRIGVQMYTLRSKLKSPEAMEEAFRRIRDMGAQCVQAYPAPGISADFLAGLSKKHALPICTMHAPFDRIQNDIDKLAEEFLTFGCKAIGIGSMPGQFRKDVKAFAELLNKAGEKLLQYNMHVTYHNHAFEFKQEQGQTRYDTLIKQTEPYVHFTPDVYWIKVGGYEPEEILAKLNGRSRVLHLKDYKRGLWPHMKEAGAGTLDFPSILRSAERAGVRDAVVELDFARRPYQSLENSLRYLNQL